MKQNYSYSYARRTLGLEIYMIQAGCIFKLSAGKVKIIDYNFTKTTERIITERPRYKLTKVNLIIEDQIND